MTVDQPIVPPIRAPLTDGNMAVRDWWLYWHQVQLAIANLAMLLDQLTVRVKAIEDEPEDTGGSQTPWTSDIDGGGFELSNVLTVDAGVGASDVYYANGLPVVGIRRVAVLAPTGGAVIDAQARTAISDLINRLSAATGGHGLIA